MLTTRQQCPACAKIGKDNGHDNLAVYSDGSTYCFSCGYSSRRTHVSSPVNNTPQTRDNLVLPLDSDESLPDSAWEYLQSYGITTRDITLNNIMFSKYFDRIIFPYVHNGKLVGWQGRSLSTVKKPKWLNRGKFDTFLHKVGNIKSDTVILTEDIISAIRVSRNTSVCASPLFNSHVALSRILDLNKHHDKIYIWLDKDKAVESMQFAKAARDIGVFCNSIITELDPKCYSDTLIKELTSNGQYATLG